MGKRERARRKKDRPEEPKAAPTEAQRRDRPRAKDAGAFYIGSGGPPMYLDAWSDDAQHGIMGDGGPVQISGRFDHAPVAGGSTAVVRYMGTGKYARPPSSMQPPPSVPRPPAPTGPFIAGFPSALPGRRCACGFEAFTWQRTCPKCARPLEPDR